MAAVAGAVVCGAGAAFAYWTDSVSSTAANAADATAGSLAGGHTPTAAVVGRDVTVSWAATANAASYAVVRANFGSQSLTTTEHGSCAGSVTTTTCADTGLPENAAPSTTATNWTYSDTPGLDNWTGAASAASTEVTIPAPGVSLTTASFTTSGGSTNATVSAFFDNEAVTYCLDQSTTPCTHQLGSGTVPASGGTTTDGLSIPAGLTVGSHTVWAVGSNGSDPSALVTVTAGPPTKLVISTSAVSGATSSTANLGPITVEEEDQFGNLATAAETVNLASTSSHGVFSGSAFGSSVTHVAIPSGQSSASFYYGDTQTGTPTLTVSATGLTSATQQETVTTAPIGLAVSITTGTGTPHLSCGTIAASYSCSITGVGNSGSATFTVQFVTAGGSPIVYSATQASTIAESGTNTGSVTIAADASSSSPSTLTAAHSGNSTKTSTLTFGPYTLTLNVGS